MSSSAEKGEQLSESTVLDLPDPSSTPSVDRFLPMARYHTNLPTAESDLKRVEVELLIDPDARTYWAVVSEVGVAAVGSTPAEAALAAMRAAAALL